MNQNRRADTSHILVHPQNLRYVWWHLSDATKPFLSIILSHVEQPETVHICFLSPNNY